MTEFVRVRQFDSEGGWGAGKFCRADYLFSAWHRLRIQNILIEHFLKAKRNKHTLKGGGVVVEVQ